MAAIIMYLIVHKLHEIKYNVCVHVYDYTHAKITFTSNKSEYLIASFSIYDLNYFSIICFCDIHNFRKMIRLTVYGEGGGRRRGRSLNMLSK